MPAITNIAAYKFSRLENLKPLRARLLGRCRELGLKGTILLSGEGINLFVAGGAEQIGMLVEELRAIPGLGDLAPKYSLSDGQPFTRMLVRIKKEIIAFGVEGIDPGARTSPKLSAQTLKQWLDEGREVMLLDTRNDYEVKLGSFRGARTLGIGHFRQFPEAVDQLPPEMKNQTVVMFCTGGIRCEKAGPLMERKGFQSVFQLEGGILKYFEECGGAHYEGECFVFDQRVGVDPALRETDSVQCFACQAPLGAEELADSRYVPGKSCPCCYVSGEEVMAKVIAVREEAIRRVANPLPGSLPYLNRRPLRVPEEFDGRALVEMLEAIFPQASRGHWQELCDGGAFVDAGDRVVPGAQIVRAGERYFRIEHIEREPEVGAEIRIVHEDRAILVVNKPAPLPMHPSGRFHRNTLQYILDEAYARERPRSMHRLDAATTGLVVFARTRHFAKLLQSQFENGTVEKIYLARVRGAPAEEAFACDFPISAAPGGFGLRDVDECDGQPARTEFRVVKLFSDGTSLLEARPLTGRTNQIRVHLWRLGYPVCGDPAYLSGRRRGEAVTPALREPPLCLHAWRISFVHPLAGKRMSFEAAPPPHLSNG